MRVFVKTIIGVAADGQEDDYYQKLHDRAENVMQLAVKHMNDASDEIVFKMSDYLWTGNEGETAIALADLDLHLGESVHEQHDEGSAEENASSD
jgi:hypothetical protein